MEVIENVASVLIGYHKGRFNFSQIYFTDGGTAVYGQEGWQVLFNGEKWVKADEDSRKLYSRILSEEIKRRRG